MFCMSQGLGKIISIDAKKLLTKAEEGVHRKIEPGTTITGGIKAAHLERGVRLHRAHIHCHMW